MVCKMGVAIIGKFQKGNDKIRLGLVLWHINPCRLFNAKSSLYIYIYILNIHDLFWLGFMA